MNHQRNMFLIIGKVILGIWALFLILGVISSAIEGDSGGIAIGITLFLLTVALPIGIIRLRTKHRSTKQESQIKSSQGASPGECSAGISGKPSIANQMEDQTDPLSSSKGVNQASQSPSVSPAIQRDRFIEIVPGGKPENNIPAITVSIRYETGGTLFLKEAQRFHDREGQSTEPIPFMRYWPTYSSMNQAQQQWYFYWRSEVRRENYLPTDLSYIFLHVYEILNLVENPDPDVAAQHIWLLWQKYRIQHPKLDNYLPDWGGDLLVLKKDVTVGLAWWQKALPLVEHPPTQVTNLIIHQMVEAGNSTEIPYKLWLKLMDYRPRNKFYQEYNTKEQLDQAYEKAIRTADEYWKSLKGQSLLLEFTSPTLYPLRKPLFSSAQIGYSHSESIELGKSRNYLGEARLNEHLNSVVKYTENLFRKKVGFARKLSGITLDTGLARALETAFVPGKSASEPFTIKIDYTRVAALHKESEQVGAILETVAKEQVPVPAKPLYTDLAEMRRLWAKLDSNDRSILERIYHSEITTVQTLTQHLSTYATLPNTYIERTNEQAIELLGDKLIYQDDTGKLSLAEDYLDELDVVIVEPLPESHLRNIVPNDTDTQWDRFFAKLAPVEIALIHLFAEKGGLTETSIESVTHAYNVMANATLDSLNEKGADALGHPPLYLDGGQWLVEDHDLPILRQQLSITEDNLNAHI